MQSQKILLLECDSTRVVAKLPMRTAVWMIEQNQAWIDSNGELHVKAPDQRHEHPCRTRLSSGGPNAALGLVDYTKRDHRGIVDGFKRIYPEDRGAFHLATDPKGWLMAAVSSAATAFMALAEAGVFLH